MSASVALAAPRGGDPPAAPESDAPAAKPRAPSDGGGGTRGSTSTVTSPRNLPHASYSVTQTDNAGAAAIKGTATITRIAGDMFKGSWKVGTTPLEGVAFLDEKHLGVGFASKQKDTHVVVYLVQGTGLDGVWFGSSDTKLGHEVLAHKAGKDLAGTYTIATGKSPDGSPYSGSVVIKKLDAPASAYQLQWTLGGIKQSGIGLLSKDGTILVVGFSDNGGPIGAASYTIGDDGTLDGRWVRSADGKITAGTETGI